MWRIHPFWVVLLSAAYAPTTSAQVLGLENSKAAESSIQEPLSDSLGRSTPRDAIASFIRAVERDDLASAARYLEVTDAQHRNTDALARDLKALMDRYFSQALTRISDSPNGELSDGLPVDRERIGPLTIGDRKIDIELIRVSDPQAGQIWLISSDTLALVPALHDLIAQSWIERAAPRSLVRRELLGLSIAHWLVFALSLLIPLLLLAVIFAISFAAAKRTIDDPAREQVLDTWYAGIRLPAIATVALTSHLMSIPTLGLPLGFRMAYARIGLLLFVIAVAWLVRRLLTLGFARARAMTRGRDAASTRSLLLLGERLFKAFLLVAALVAVLLILGVEAKTALAAFGIVGVALALGAQKTVENLLGGVFMLSDRAIAVGDLCSISNRLGWIEDITLRSVRLRTLDNSLVSVPAGVLAQEGIENFATREKILAQSILRLQHGTRADQLRRILNRIRKLLDDNPRIERYSSRIRLVNFSPESIELELFAYVLTADVSEFLAIREELLLEIATVVESEGSGFAKPTQFIYMDETPFDRTANARHDVRNDKRAPHSLPNDPTDNEVLAASR